MWRLMSDYTLV